MKTTTAKATVQPTSEGIRRMVLEGNESEITKEMLLESLDQEGIRDLNTFAERSLEALRVAQPIPLEKLQPELAEKGQEEAIIDLLFGDASRKAAKDVSHREPRLPFVVGTTHYKPSEIRRFDGKNLHFVWDSDLLANGLMRAVTESEEMQAYFSSTSGRASLLHHVPGTGHTFFQHINCTGAALSLPYRHGFPDLTMVVMSGWWFWAVSWNDQISSLITGSGPVVLAEHIMDPYLTGATMTIASGTTIAWIGDVWNDRISAILG